MECITKLSWRWYLLPYVRFCDCCTNIVGLYASLFRNKSDLPIVLLVFRKHSELPRVICFFAPVKHKIDQNYV